MKHHIRINGEIKEIDCEFGSGILDKNGREIFEGDRVKLILPYYGIERYVDTSFWFGGKELNEYDSDELEIVD